jgi:G:T/U-mismatch repair DNA glycosylase
MDRLTSMLRSGIALVNLALLVVGCASPSLVPEEQAVTITTRERALSPHSSAIQEAIRQSGRLGALAFLDATDGRLVVLPGDSPTDAWARYMAPFPESGPSPRASVPAVVNFVYRAEVPKAPETVTAVSLQEHGNERLAAEALRTSLAALREEQRRTEETLGTVAAHLTQLSASLAAAKEETQQSMASAREDMQKALTSLAADLAAARRFMLQTAQLGWLNHELTVENANILRTVSTASQELTVTSARLAQDMRQLSEDLASQLKQLGDRLESIQSKIGNTR